MKTEKELVEYLTMLDFYLDGKTYESNYREIKHYVQYDVNKDWFFVFLRPYKEVELPTKYKSLEYHHGDRLIHFNNLDELKLYFDHFFIEYLRNKKLNTLK